MAAIEIAALRTEGIHCPLGLDVDRPRLSWSFGRPGDRGGRQSAYRIAVATSEERLKTGMPDAWDSGIVSTGAHTSIAYEGASLLPRQRYYWRVTVWDEQGQSSTGAAAWWETGMLSGDRWTGRWIGASAGAGGERRLVQLRRSFDVKGPVARARAYISGLGHYEMRLNGAKVGRRELEPGWTDYDKTVLYSIHDLTSRVRQGENAVGVLLGNGFYRVAGGRYAKFKDSYGEPACLAELVIDYDDGTTEKIVTDRTWSASESPLTFSCIYGGEDYDAGLEQEGWDEPGFAENDSWSRACELPPPRGKLLAQSSPPLAVMKRFPASVVSEPRQGVYVYDLGQNISGWPSIRITGPQGARVKLKPAELLTDEGLANQKYSGSPYELNYALKGGSIEEWRPRFSYYGFRYVQVEGAVPCGKESGGKAGLPVLHGLEGEMIYPDTPACGGFRCSDPLLNRIHENINWAILGNMKSIFTDCPHREKLGWLEQLHLMGPSVMFNYDIEALLDKIMRDMADAQLPSGMVPTTAPEYVVFKEPWHIFRDAAAWGGSYILAAWEMLQRYGSTGPLERHYDGMRRYLDYLTGTADGFILRAGLGDWYDIGPKGPGFAQNTPVELAETAVYFGLARAMRQIAIVLGKEEDAAAYASLAESIKQAFNEAFYDSSSGQYAEGSDAAMAMPLAIGLAPEERRGALLSRLVRHISERGWMTNAGDVGHRYVLLALARGGRSDVVYRMTRSTDTPGYGYQIAHGATTLTEAWDGPTVGKSQNHFMLGHLEEWLYGGLAGLDYRYQPGTGRFIVKVKPAVVGDVAWAEAWQELRPGKASVRWELGPGRTIAIKAEIPANSEGRIYIPAAQDAEVRKSGPEADYLGREDGYAVYRTGPGCYFFKYKNL
ncbi:alpha-L-rhamnosidase [Paenibacillus arenilitoris]|uniref:alpha-L-rhamnosidase n=1 Tax=Paenibacillus arenilitoris TaxID=2772299 RepID=UPI00295B1A3C|nr:family 78 glycoside hydrolase catalytic domain [Paenibacillus arenilitoris]